MRWLLRGLLPLVAVLFCLTGATWWIVDRTTERWFQRDVDLRAQLAARSAQAGLGPALAGGDAATVEAVLRNVVRDDRITAATVCAPDFREVARTELLAEDFACPALGRWLGGAALDDATPATRIAAHAGGRVHIAVVPIAGERGVRLGAIALIHDMSFADRRVDRTRWFFLGALGVLALTSAVATLALSRLAFRAFSSEVRRALRSGEAPDRQFRPLLADLRELAARLSSTDVDPPESRRWGPERLRSLVSEQFPAEKVLIVANREPYMHVRTDGGGPKVIHPASGLVTALEPVMRACAGVWVAHGSGSADRETSDARGRLRVPPGEEAYTLRRVWLSAEEEKGYYYGFANEGLWPLCHVAHARPIFRKEDWEHYQAVNQRFVDAAIDEAEQPDPIVLIQDYHFAVAPAQLRAKLPRATIVTFWHIPWPNVERFGICPRRRELIEGLLGSTVIGFHTQGHCNNFLDTVDRYLEARIDREDQAVIHKGHRTRVRPYPISVEWPSRWAAAAPPVVDCHRLVREELGLPEDTRLGLGVDRLDYTKGIEERLLAVECLLDQHPEWRGRFTFVQMAAPSRTEIPRYRELNDAVEALAARVNAKFATDRVPAIKLLRAHHEPRAVFTYYRAAELCYVSSLHDGMNLVAKEYVAARDDEEGALILSSFAGASRELTEALIVNPYDIEQAAAALHRALTMPRAEQRARMHAMRELIAEFNVYRWAGHMLADAARLRRTARLAAGEVT